MLKGNCVTVFTFAWYSTFTFLFPSFEFKEFKIVESQFTGDKIRRVLHHYSIPISQYFTIGITQFFDSQWFFMWYSVTALGQHKRGELRHSSSFKKSESGVCQFQVKYNCKVTSFKKDM